MPGVGNQEQKIEVKILYYLPSNFKGQKGKMIGEDDYVDNAKINKDVYFQVGEQ